MPLSRTWYASANRALDLTTTALNSAQSAVFALKGFLTGAIAGTAGASGAPPSSSYWTIETTSDGVTAGAGDNLGGGTFNATKWLRAAAGVAHSWFVLKSPASPGITDGPWYLMVSMGTSSDQNIIIAISKNNFTGGTTTADPTSTNQSTYTSFQFHPNSTTAGKAHFYVDANGNFWFLVSKNSTGYCHWAFTGQTLTEARSSGDSGRFIILQAYSDSGRGAPNWHATSQSWRGMSQDGTTAITSTTGLTANFTFSGTGLDSLTQSNNIDSQVDSLPACYLYDNTTSHKGVRGRIPDLWYCGAQAAVGAGDPSAASPTKAIVGGMILPCEVVPNVA